MTPSGQWRTHAASMPHQAGAGQAAQQVDNGSERHGREPPIWPNGYQRADLAGGEVAQPVLRPNAVVAFRTPGSPKEVMHSRPHSPR
jgi:hypothetical protein